MYAQKDEKDEIQELEAQINYIDSALADTGTKQSNAEQLVFPKTLYLFFFSPTINFDDYYLLLSCFSLLFSTHKYILTGVFSSLGLNRITYLLHQV